jgi:hypothetical protein
MKYKLESKRTMKWLLQLACVYVAAVAPVRADSAGLITFDDLIQPGPSYVGILPAGYAGFQWNNFLYMDAVGQNHQYGPSGYFNGMVSASNVVFNAGGNAASLTSHTAFNFVAADVTGAWKDGLQVEAKGFLGSTLIYDRIFTVDSTGPSLITFNFFDVTRVDFTSSGGIEHGYPSSAGDGEQFVLDNITTIPEPPMLTMAALGLAMLVYPFRRSRGAGALSAG